MSHEVMNCLKQTFWFFKDIYGIGRLKYTSGFDKLGYGKFDGIESLLNQI